MKEKINNIKNNNSIINIEQKSKLDPNKPITKIIFLGGLNEVGKNMLCIEHEDEIFIIDCGIKMLGYNELGYNIIIPNFDYLIERKNKIKGMLITHGHEDHIGAIPYFLKAIPECKIYLPKLAYQILFQKFKKFNINDSQVNTEIIDSKTVIKSKHFHIQYYDTVHSIPDAYGIIVNTINGKIIASGDWRIDFTPLGNKTEFHKLVNYQEKKCDLLLSDSTNSCVEDFSISEKIVMNNINQIVQNAKGRVIIAAFSSNVYRIHNIIQIGIKHNRKICVLGCSMENMVKISSKINYFHSLNFKKYFIFGKNIKNVAPKQMLCICTGSQGESLSALWRMSQNQHSIIKILPSDTIIFSSKAIPGNFLSVELVVNNLKKLGAKIIQHTPNLAYHTSGHASRNEQKLFFALVKPNYFVPIHGEYHMLVAHCETANEMGLKKNNCFVCENGSIVKLQNHNVFYSPNDKITAGPVYIDGKNFIKEKTNIPILSNRKLLYTNGIVIILSYINFKSKKIIEKLFISIKGTLYVKNNFKLLKKFKSDLEEYIQKIANEFILKQSNSLSKTNNEIVKLLKNNVIKYVKTFFRNYKRKRCYVYVNFLTKNNNEETNNNDDSVNNKTLINKNNLN